MQYAGRAGPGIVNCASDCVCGRDKGGFWREHTPSASASPVLSTVCSSNLILHLATDAWWELAFFHAHLVGDEQNPVQHFGRVGSSAHMCCSAGELQESLQTVGLALYSM